MVSCVDNRWKEDAAIMLRTGVQDPRHLKEKKYLWQKKTILIVQSTKQKKIYHSRLRQRKPAQHAECAFLDELESDESGGWNLEFEDSVPLMKKYELYINNSPCVDCAQRIIQFIIIHPSVQFHIHYAMLYKDGGDGLRMLTHQQRITLATMNSGKWQSVITAILDFHKKEIPVLEKIRRNNSGYESLAKVVKYLNIIKDSDKWTRWRENDDKTEQEKLANIQREGYE